MDPAPQLEPPSHDDPDGPIKGWSAADVPPEAYVDDDYLDGCPTVEIPEEEWARLWQE